MKRLLDILIASIAFLILFPVFIYTAFKVRRHLGEPIFFYQERPGKDGQLFKMIKFRSMKDVCDAQGNPLSDEERITPFGQKLRSTSVDEMPQLLNVIKGDMSIVGPRPQLSEFMKHYSEQQKRRHHVKPGMTGLAQISGRNHLSWEQKFRLDVWYVDHQSLYLDFKIMAKTVKVMRSKEGVDQPGMIGAEAFKGTFHKNKEH